MEFEGFIYLDIENPIVAWNVYRGVLVSQKLVQQGTGDAPALSMAAANIFLNSDWDRYKFELELEKVRRSQFPECVSRLKCLYLFDNTESALAAAEDTAWGGHIKIDYLTDVGASAAPNLTRLDANWISWMLKRRLVGGHEWKNGISPYWQKKRCQWYATSIWETLIDGAITIWGTTLRQSAYDTIKKHSPKSLCLLEQSRLAAGLGSDLGHVTALITGEKDRAVMSFHIDMRDADDPDYIRKLNLHIQNHPDQVNHQDLAVADDKFYLPNFIAHSYAFNAN